MRRWLRLAVALACYGWAACAADKPPVANDAKKEAQEEAQRPCKDEDLVGHLFKMVFFSETPPGMEAGWLKVFPYHYLAFYKENRYNLAAIHDEFKNVHKVEKYVQAVPQKYYTLSKDGVLDLIDNDKIKYHYRCIAVLKPEGEYVPGDLILTAYTKRGKTVLYKLYRRWY